MNSALVAVLDRLAMAATRVSLGFSAEICRFAVARRARPSPLPDHVRFTLMLDLPRALAERLSARAIREGNNLEALVLEALKASLERG